MKLEARLRVVFKAIVEEARQNPDFARRLETALGPTEAPAGPAAGARRHRRPPAPFDPYSIYEHGEGELRRRLEALDLEELKNMVAEHGMDASKLALKWKSPDRLIELIVVGVAARSHKGDAFRGERP